MGLIFGFIMGLLIGSVIGALLLQLATKVIAKFNLLYSTAFVAAFVGILVTNLASFVISFIYSIFGQAINFFGFGLVAIFSVGFYSWLLGTIISKPEKGKIGFKMGLSISLLYLVLAAIIYFLGVNLFKFASHH